jgi:hypothetical protein
MDLLNNNSQIKYVNSFEELVSTSFEGEVNAVCWRRQLDGNFAEIVHKIVLSENLVELDHEVLCGLELSDQGNLAREVLLEDLKLLKVHGASPVLNIIQNYERDDALPFFPTDVYSFHVDRSPIPTDTFLCTYYGASSEILPNSEGEQKILIPEIRDQLKKLYQGTEEGFESFLSEYFFDLHYQAKPYANPISLGIGHVWKLAIDHPESKVLPCLHRAPEEKDGQNRLLLIC